MSIERISDADLGIRLRKARDDAKIKQEDAAHQIGITRTTLVSIEQGTRRVRIDELQKLARAYGTTVNAICRVESTMLDLVPSFRRLADSSSVGVEQASHLLNELARAEVELENMLGASRAVSYPPERPLLAGDVRLQAEQDSQYLRDWLGIGVAPIVDVISLLEHQLGIRVYVRPLEDYKISGLFAFDEVAGACILLNAKHPADRLRMTATHELGHFVSARRRAEVFVEGEGVNSREERYAVAFAAAFLMPARAVTQQFSDLSAGQSHLSRRLVIFLSSYFGVSREAVVRRLEALKLIRSGAWEWFEANGGITDQQAQEVLGEMADRHAHLRSITALPARIALLAQTAWTQGLYTEGQLSRLLHLTRQELRETLQSLEHEEEGAVDSIKILR